MKKYLLLVALLALSACSTTFLAYEGRSDLIFEGAGGARTTVDGIDFWQHGDPPRTYQLLGYIKDKRGRGLISTLTKEGDVAAKAKQAGGDAVMVLEAHQTITGYARTAFVSGGRRSLVGGAVTVPIGNADATFAVLKYVVVPDAAGPQGNPYGAPAQATAVPAPQPSGIPLGPAMPKPTAAPAARAPVPTAHADAQAPMGHYTYQVERLAKDASCSANPVVRLVAKGPGVENYTVVCVGEDILSVRCDYGQCHVLR